MVNVVGVPTAFMADVLVPLSYQLAGNFSALLLTLPPSFKVIIVAIVGTAEATCTNVTGSNVDAVVVDDVIFMGMTFLHIVVAVLTAPVFVVVVVVIVVPVVDADDVTGTHTPPITFDILFKCDVGFLSMSTFSSDE